MNTEHAIKMSYKGQVLRIKVNIIALKWDSIWHIMEVI